MMTKQTLILPLLFAIQAHGAGYQLAERSAKGLGRAFSGEAAIGDDASILGSNPAGMSLLDDWSFAVGFNFINADVDVDGTGAGGAPVRGRDVIPEAVVPYAYLSKKIDDQLTFGIGVYTTYGLQSDYSSETATFVGVDYSELLSFNINPALAYRINDQWTIGAGFNALFAEGNLTSLRPGVGTDLFDLKGEDWGFGYNVGVLYEASAGTRIGLHFRSAIDLTLKGDAELGAPLPEGTFDADLEVELPDSIELSIYHELDSKWALHGDVLWTNWSRFRSLDPKVNPALDPAFAKEQDWNDAFRFSVGATYQHNDRLTLRCGLAYDESPTTSRNRALRIPDGDRIWASIGASYVWNDTYTIDFGYTRIFANDVTLATEANGGNSDFFNGDASGDVNLLALGLSGSF